jgi:hypothetical protein
MMGKVIRVDFKNGSKVSLLSHPKQEDLLRGAGDNVSPIRRWDPRGGVVLTIPWERNKYASWDIVDLLQEGARFNQSLLGKRGYVTPEICRWGIELFEATAVKAATPEYRATCMNVAIRLREQLDLFEGPDGAA